MFTGPPVVLTILIVIMVRAFYHQLNAIHRTPNICKGRMLFTPIAFWYCWIFSIFGRQIFASSFWCKTEIRIIIENVKYSETQVYVMPIMTSKINFKPQVPIHTKTKPRASDAITSLGRCNSQLLAQEQSSCPSNMVSSYQIDIQSHAKLI